MTTRREAASATALAVPLLLVNSAAVYGQAGWAYEHLVHSWPIAGLFAGSIESIGVYLAFEAHSALMAGDASGRLRAGSYGVGLLAGALNYAHFASTGYRPTPLAVTFAALSSISPWLWAIRSRSMNRARLRELGQVDPRAVRFSLLRWALFPIRTVRAFRVAVWHGIVQPAEAVARSGVRAPGLPPQVAPPVAHEPLPAAPGEAMTLAELTTPREVADQVALPAVLPLAITAAPVADDVAPEPVAEPVQATPKFTPLPIKTRAQELAEAVASGELGSARAARILGTDNRAHVYKTLRETAKEVPADPAAPDPAEAADPADTTAAGPTHEEGESTSRTPRSRAGRAAGSVARRRRSDAK